MSRQCTARVIATYKTHSDSATERQFSSSNSRASRGGKNLPHVLVDVPADDIDRLGGAGPADDKRLRPAGEQAVELRQHDDVELQPLGLVDRHHPHIGRGGVGDAAALDESQEIVGPQRAFRLVFVSQLDQLLQAVLVAGIAECGQLLSPGKNDRPVPFVQQLAADAAGESPGGQPIGVVGKFQRGGQRRMGQMEPRHLVARMIGQR